MKTQSVSIKRIGCSVHYEILSFKNRISIDIGDKTFKVHDRLTENEVETLCKRENINVTIR